MKFLQVTLQFINKVIKATMVNIIKLLLDTYDSTPRSMIYRSSIIFTVRPNHKDVLVGRFLVSLYYHH